MNQIKNIQYTCVEGKDQIAKFCIVPLGESFSTNIKRYLKNPNNKISRNVMPPHVRESLSIFDNHSLDFFLTKIGVYDNYEKRNESIAFVDAFVYPKNKNDKFFYYRVHYIGFDMDRKGSICAISRVLKPAEKSPNLKTVETVICRKGLWIRNGFAWRQSYLREDIENQFTVENLDRAFKEEYDRAYNNHIGADPRDKYSKCQYPNDEILYTNRELHKTLLQPLKLKDKTVITRKLQSFGEFAFKYGPMFVYNNRHTLLPSKDTLSIAELRACICASNDLMWYHDNVNKNIHGEVKIVHVEIEEIKDQEMLDMISFGQEDNYNYNRSLYRKYKKYPGTITMVIVLETAKTKKHLKFTHKFVLNIGNLATCGLPYNLDPEYETSSEDLLKSLDLVPENKNKRRYSLDVLKESLDPLFEKAESKAESDHPVDTVSIKAPILKFNEETTAADEAVYESTHSEDDKACDVDLEEILAETDHPED